MKKLKRWMYSKTLLQMLTVLLMVSIFTPLTAYTMATEAPLPTVEPMATERVAAESGDMLLLDQEAEGENLLPLDPTAENSEPTADGEARRAVYGLSLFTSEGEELPGGINLSTRANSDGFPTVILENMISVEELPRSLMLTDGAKKVLVQ